MAPVPYYKTFLSVRDYGAVGNNVADDTAAVLEAFEAAVTSGKALYFPAGIYLIAQPLDASTLNVSTEAAIAIVGEGTALSQICMKSDATSGTTILKAARAANQGRAMLVRDIYLDASLPTAGAVLPALDLQRIERGLFQNLRVKGSNRTGGTAVGIRDVAGNENTYRDVMVTSCQNQGMLIDGIDASNKAIAVRVINGRFKNNTGLDLQATSLTQDCIFDVVPEAGGTETFDPGPVSTGNLLFYRGHTPQLTVAWDTPDPQSGNEIQVLGRLKDLAGNSLAEQVIVWVRVTPNNQVGESTLTRIEGTASGIGTTVSPVQVPTVAIKTDSNGQMKVRVVRPVAGSTTVVNVVTAAGYGTQRLWRDGAPASLTFA